MSSVPRPLEGLKVIDLSRVLAGPMSGQMLADMGADVIKIEAPTGDENRGWGPFTVDGKSCNFMSVNRGKRGITLNLKDPRGRDILYRLLESADVLIQSFLPQTAERLGVDPAALQERFPRLVIACITAFGAHGELANRPGYDSVIQSFSGIMAMTGEKEGLPVRSGVSFVDMTTGIYAYSGILTALEGRRKTGRGTTVRVSLLETAIGLLGYHGVGWLEAGVVPGREGSGVGHLIPYQVFRCADGEILTGALNDHTWLKLCNAVDRPDLAADESLRTNVGRVEQREHVLGELCATFEQQPVSYWAGRFKEFGVPIAPLHTIADSLQHPQTLANNMVVEVELQNGRPVKLLGSSFKLDSIQNHSNVPPPDLGEHTREVLSGDLGLNTDEIDALREQGVV